MSKFYIFRRVFWCKFSIFTEERETPSSRYSHIAIQYVNCLGGVKYERNRF